MGKRTGLSRNFIIHPGETLEEILEEHSITRKELALRTNVTEKHICKVINGDASISTDFARKLEIALGIDASFWQNLQNNYDLEILKFEEAHSISEEELTICKKLKKEIFQWISEHNLYYFSKDFDSLVLEARNFFKVVTLEKMNQLVFSGAYRANSKISYDNDILYAWEFIGDLLTQNVTVTEITDFSNNKKMVLDKIDQIKALMSLEIEEIIPRLTAILSSCGIAFSVVPKFKGAPVQGLMKRSSAGKYILCLTVKTLRADIFWFNLFHELGHFINGDVGKYYVDFEAIATSEKESKADKFAKESLISPTNYEDFISQDNFYDLEKIISFAKTQNIEPWIVIGRLQKEGKIKWSTYSSFIKTYSI